MSNKVSELEADLEFLMRAALKIETIREDLGKVGPVIAIQVEEAMLGKRNRQLDTSKAEKESEPIKKMLTFERKLRDQLDKLANQLQQTQQTLNLTAERIENVVNVGLDLAGQPALIPKKMDNTCRDSDGFPQKKSIFDVPNLSNSWAQCLNGLAHPHTKVIRPIVFDSSYVKGRDDIVLAHLNHRLVQMCLRLLRAEIWSLGNHSKHLSRVSACVTDDTSLKNPVVIAHGRIVVLGADNHRLHEEIITAGGELFDYKFQRLNVSETQSALSNMTEIEVPELVCEHFRTLWSKHEKPLINALEARKLERTKNLEKQLSEQSEKEVGKLTAIMMELKRAIEKELAPTNKQFDLFSDALGKEQYERDLNSLRYRLEEIPKEIEREAEHIRSRFSTPSARLFPVAVTYLIPKSFVSKLTGVNA
jgi:exonuclease VII large subunit